uniref:Uncharacterized protein n=1 Tax=Knipowitschia caucasica TaxID=637954 RepID=A0AAV2IWE6_KNICA
MAQANLTPRDGAAGQHVTASFIPTPAATGELQEDGLAAGLCVCVLLSVVAPSPSCPDHTANQNPIGGGDQASMPIIEVYQRSRAWPKPYLPIRKNISVPQLPLSAQSCYQSEEMSDCGGPALPL